MAMLQDNNFSRSSSNYSRKASAESGRRGSNTQASAYVVDASTMALTGLHFSTSRARGVGCGNGGPGDAAYHITEECERLFCETLKTVFLVEKDSGLENSLVMGMPESDTRHGPDSTGNTGTGTGMRVATTKRTKRNDIPTPSPSPDTKVFPRSGDYVSEYVEVFDYVGGAVFRGFVTDKDDERSLFVFFERDIVGKDLKPGLMSLLELASSDMFGCDHLVIGIERSADAEAASDLIRSLGWVGFELTLLDMWAGQKNCVSDRWVFLGMEV